MWSRVQRDCNNTIMQLKHTGEETTGMMYIFSPTLFDTKSFFKNDFALTQRL